MPWLRQRLRAIDATATDFARNLEIAPARVYEMIKGQRQLQAHELPKAATFLRISEACLIELLGGRIEAKDVSINATTEALPWASTAEKPVPLLFATLATNGRWLLRAPQEGRPGPREDFIRFPVTAFAIVVQDERNSPVYRVADRILVDPESVALAGDDVVLSSANTLNDHRDLHVIPGHLERTSETAWFIRQYAIGQEHPYAKRQFPSAWKIVGRFMRG